MKYKARGYSVNRCYAIVRNLEERASYLANKRVTLPLEEQISLFFAPIWVLIDLQLASPIWNNVL